MYKNSESLQRDFFESIGEKYLVHYNDYYSKLYRKKFIYNPMVEGIDLKNKIILDAMCGSGQISEFINEEVINKHHKVIKNNQEIINQQVNHNRCELHGLDISDKQINLYKKRFPDTHCHVRSILDTGFPDSYFDLVLMCGGLHHVHPNIYKAVTEIYRIIKPGGFFIFAEPHAYTIVDKARRFWYATDHFFMNNESAIDYVELENYFSGQPVQSKQYKNLEQSDKSERSDRSEQSDGSERSIKFRTIKVTYLGNIAYYLIYNSLILRIPLRVKKIIAPFALFLESAILPFQTHFLSSYLVAQWQKT